MAGTASSLQAPVIIGPMNGITTYDDIPTIEGTVEPGCRVEVFLDGTRLCNVTPQQTFQEYRDLEHGTLHEPPIRRDYWKCIWHTEPYSNTYTTRLSDGVHRITARALDQGGNVSPLSSPLTITLDTTRTIFRHAKTYSGVALSRSIGSSIAFRTNDTTPTLFSVVKWFLPSYPSFPSPQEVVVEVYVDSTLIGTSNIYRDLVTYASGDSGAAWLFTPSVPLQQGIHLIAARATDRAGNRGLFSEVVALAVDTTAPPAPVITSPAIGTRSSSRSLNF